MKEKLDVGFVILHYITLNDTIECVKSIEKHIDTDKYKIVIVDNASPNDSLNGLQKTFKKDNKVIIFPNSVNEGFSKGNNRGIDILKAYYDIQYIVVLNNDTLILQNNMMEYIIKEFQMSRFSVLGPLIFTADGRCDSSPCRHCCITIKEVYQQIKRVKRDININKCHLNLVYGLISKIKKKLIHSKKIVIYKNYLDRQENVQLHGCFLIFSRLYFEKFNGFDTSTFLYMEEEILFAHLYYNNMKSVYLPSIAIYHKEDSATNSLSLSDRGKVLFKAKHVLDSTYELLKILKKYEK